ncbi:Ig-like domain repeat protein [Aeromicrobium sp. UC242_57]|uniref:Ig-like domain repeat protein n=1 Tax=Aeromicrobium sp. UC242_57 TaxID=3374624 RepID=UPI00378D63C0
MAFTTSDAAIAASGVSAAHTYSVSKGAVAAPTFKVTKKITAKKAGSLTVRLATPSGLARPTGKVDVILKKGRKTVTIRNKTVAGNGQVKVKVPKQKAGKWTVTISYKGDTRYNAKKSAAKKITIAKK